MVRKLLAVCHAMLTLRDVTKSRTGFGLGLGLGMSGLKPWPGSILYNGRSTVSVPVPSPPRGMNGYRRTVRTPSPGKRGLPESKWRGLLMGFWGLRNSRFRDSFSSVLRGLI